MLTGKPFGMGAQNRSAGIRRVKRVENDEFIVAVSSAATGANFGNTAFACNPGQASTFPWLAGEATQWEKYRFEYLEFYYEHDVSSFATAGTTGKVIMSFDYDAVDSPPTSKQQMLDTEPHADGMPNEDFGLSMNPRDLDGRTDMHYVRLAGLPGGADIRLYDVGNLNVATQGIASNATEVGELHVRYAVVFEVPILSSDTKAAPANNQVSQFQSTGAEAGVSGVDILVAFANTQANGLAIVNTAGSFVPPAGNYLVDVWLTVGAATDITLATLDFEVDGTPTLTVLPSFATAAGSLVTKTELSFSLFTSANGTNAFTVEANITGTGATSAGGIIRWTAV